MEKIQETSFAEMWMQGHAAIEDTRRHAELTVQLSKRPAVVHVHRHLEECNEFCYKLDVDMTTTLLVPGTEQEGVAGADNS